MQAIVDTSAQHPFRLLSLLPRTSALDGYAHLLGAWLIAFWSLVVRARITLGEWPFAQHLDLLSGSKPQSPTISAMTFPGHAFTVWVGLAVLLVLLPVEILIATRSIFVSSLRPSRQLTLVLLGLTTLVGVTVFVDPGGFFVWFMD